MSLLSETRMDKTVFSTVSLHDPPDEPAYWRTQSHQARMEALEFLRQLMYGNGYNPSTDRLPRVIEVVEYAPR